jgi:hypothetical protein
MYSINQSTGALTSITTAIATGTNAYGIAADPTGRFVYVTNSGSNNVSQYAINNFYLPGGAQTLTGDLTAKTINSSIVTLTTNNGTLDCSTGSYFIQTISSSTTYSFTNVPSSVAYGMILEVNHTGGTITWPSSVKWPADTAPILTLGKTHIFVLLTDDGGTRWRGSSLANYTT